jgi:hypothetical protein
MEPTVYLDRRERRVAQLTDGGDREPTRALARAKAVEGGVLEFPG